jgi:hypothetical protein
MSEPRSAVLFIIPDSKSFADYAEDIQAFHRKLDNEHVFMIGNVYIEELLAIALNSGSRQIH